VKFIRGNGMVSVQLPVLVAAAVILGPALAAWVGMAVPWTYRELRGEVRWPSVAFNRAQFALIAWMAAWLFRDLGGSVMHLTLASMSLPLIIAGVAAFFANMFLVVLAFHFRLGRPVLEIWRVHFKWMTFNFWAMVPISYLMAAVYHQGGVWPEFIFLMPLGLSRWIFSLFVVVRQFYQNTVNILMTALDAKDPYTRGHSMRVGRFAGMLAREMGLAEDMVEEVQRAAALHDVGKLGIPDAILNKPGQLTPHEMLVIQRHPLLGGAILSQIEGIGYSRDWVLHHHERWDGQGYPHSLAGEQIPLAARITAVVDAYDAMTTDRPYRQALPHQQALLEIQAAAGTQLDPQVVDAFLNMVQGRDLADEESLGGGFTKLLGGDLPFGGESGSQASLSGALRLGTS
ncbi:MAG: HD-GYP domain-containing protein, partial [Clostridia bacterium]